MLNKCIFSSHTHLKLSTSKIKIISLDFLFCLHVLSRLMVSLLILHRQRAESLSLQLSLLLLTLFMKSILPVQFLQPKFWSLIFLTQTILFTLLLKSLIQLVGSSRPIPPITERQKLIQLCGDHLVPDFAKQHMLTITLNTAGLNV